MSIRIGHIKAESICPPRTQKSCVLNVEKRRLQDQKKKKKKRAIFANAVCVVASNCVLCPFTLEINIASFKPVTLLAVRPLCASLNFYIKAQCASAFHHLFIWANGIVHGDSMIRRSEEMHSALHPHAHTHVCTHAALLAFANCIFIKRTEDRAISSQTQLLALRGAPWTCN